MIDKTVSNCHGNVPDTLHTNKPVVVTIKVQPKGFVL